MEAMESHSECLAWRLVRIALVLIAVCGAVALWWLWFEARARCREATKAVREIRDAALAFRKEEGRWPDSIRELLVPKGSPPAICVRPPKDPWGQEYRLEIEGERCVVLSLGRDHRPGGWGEDADVEALTER